MFYKNVKETSLEQHTKNLNYSEPNGEESRQETLDFADFYFFCENSFLDITNNPSLENIHVVLCKFDGFRDHPFFLKEKIFELFLKHSAIQNLMRIVFGVAQNPSEANIVLVDEIFYLFLSVSKSPSFTYLLTSLGFIQFFFQNFNQFSTNSQQTGILISSNCVSDFDDNAAATFFQDNLYFEFFLDSFPRFPTEFSFLLFSITAKIKTYPISLVKRTTDLLSSIISSDLDPKLIENILKILAVLLNRYPKLSASYIKKYRSSFKIAFQFYEVDFRDSNNNFKIKYSFFEICRMLIDSSTNVNRTKFVIYHIVPAASLLVKYLLEVPKLQYPILKLFLSMATKGQDSVKYLFDSMLISALFKIQDNLKFEEITVMKELLGFIIDYDFKEDTKIVIEILVKMLELDIPEFQDSVLENLIILCKNLTKIRRIEDIRKDFINCDGINTIIDLSTVFQKAQIIASELSFVISDEENHEICE